MTDGHALFRSMFRHMAVGVAVYCSAGFAVGLTYAEEKGGALIAALAAGGHGESSIETAYEPSGRPKVAIQGDFYDARPLLQAVLAGLSLKDQSDPSFDINLDIKVAKLAGFNGETLCGVELKLSVEGGAIREFALTAKAGAEAGLTGSLRSGNISLETSDAGTLLRFTNIYRHMRGGRLRLAMDVSPQDATQEGTVTVENFTVAVEPAFEFGVSANRAEERRMAFSRLWLKFKPAQGRAVISDALLSGHALVATASGQFDFVKGDIGLRGTILPLFQQPALAGLIVEPNGLEGLYSLSYSIRGQLQTPIVQINPAGPLAPGILRKLFEYKVNE